MGSPTTVTCDQAVFTSVRTGTGEGYRVISVSPGVQAAEKVEITRRCPSHGGLCQEDDPEAVGLEAYVLPTKRYCVAFCCHAGCEHTARGGQRVYTHAVILDRQGWRDFQANPVAVHAALAQRVQSAGPMLKPVRLEKVPLTPPAPVTNLPAVGQPLGWDTVDWALSTATDVLGGQRIILLDAPNPFRMLEKILLSLPLETREKVDASVGVRFSPARRMHLTFTDESEAELRRRINGLDIQIRRVNRSPDRAAAMFEGWERLLRRWWREGRRQDIQRLTAELCRGVSCDALDRVAAICEDTDSLADLSADAVGEVIARHSSAQPPTKAEQVLVQELLQKASEQLACLQAPASPQ